METTINISGPGGTFSYELNIIIKALREHGIEVNFKDPIEDHYHKGQSPEEIIRTIRKHKEESKYFRKDVVNIVTYHAPWGG